MSVCPARRPYSVCLSLQCLRELKRTLQEKEERYKSLASLDEMQAKLEELQKQMAWALVTFSSPSSLCLKFKSLLKCGLGCRLTPCSRGRETTTTMTTTVVCVIVRWLDLAPHR